MYKAKMEKSVDIDESINKISWSVSKEYTAQSVLIDIYTQFFFFFCFQLICSSLGNILYPSQVRSKDCHILHGVVVTIH